MSQREDLIAALLADPHDGLCLLALADWHEEQGHAARPAALRLAYALREVPWPEEPDEACRRFFVDPAYRSLAEVHESQAAAHLKPCGTWWGLPSLRGMDWPRCRGWAGVGRLPAVAPALRLLCEGRPAWARQVVRCELYSCGVLTAAERDAEAPPDMDGAYTLYASTLSGPPAPDNWDNYQYRLCSDLWRLRGGPAGRAMPVMQRAEFARVYRSDGGYAPSVWPRQRSSREAQALARTYTRSVLREFLSARPWELGLYQERQVAA